MFDPNNNNNNGIITQVTTETEIQNRALENVSSDIVRAVGVGASYLIDRIRYLFLAIINSLPFFSSTNNIRLVFFSNRRETLNILRDEITRNFQSSPNNLSTTNTAQNPGRIIRHIGNRI